MSSAVITEHKKLVLTSAENNNNKFWEYTIFSDDTIEYKWGRIGNSHQESGRQPLARNKHENKVREKLDKGYREIALAVSASGPAGAATKIERVKETAVRDIAGGDKALEALISRLAEANKHELQVASGGQLDIDLTTGIISTPLGVVTLDNIKEARKLLKGFSKVVKAKSFDTTEFKHSLSEYLMLVPQKVAHRNWHLSFLTTRDDLKKQVGLLDQLETSVELATQRLEDAKKAAANGTTAPAKSFEVKIEVIEDGSPEFSRIVKFYRDSKNDMHVSKHLVPKRAYRVHIPSMRERFEADGAKLTNNWELWHGTRTFNVLSIMKQGLIIPKSGGTYQVTGRLYGDGLYFSDQSTKSLNYAYGYWDGGGKDNNCFMFLAQVGMGNMYTPGGRSGGYGYPQAGYDSTFAKAGQSGVMNNEMIVYRLGQADLRFLVEFGDR